MVYAMYHPAAALRATEVERTSYEDAAGIPAALLEARRRRAGAQPPATAEPAAAGQPPAATPAGEPAAAGQPPAPTTSLPPPDPVTADPALDAPTFF
jgi:hypothetical protein